MSPLLALPRELLILIAFFVGNNGYNEDRLECDELFWLHGPEDLRNLSFTCKLMYDLAFPMVYRITSLPINALMCFKQPYIAALIKIAGVKYCDGPYYPADEKDLFNKTMAQYFPPDEHGDAHEQLRREDMSFIFEMTCLVPCRNLERLFILIDCFLNMYEIVDPDRLRHLTFPHLRELNVKFNFDKGSFPLNSAMAAIVRQAPNLKKCVFDTADTAYADDSFQNNTVEEVIFKSSVLTEDFCNLIFAKFPRLERFSYSPYVRDYNMEPSVTPAKIKRNISEYGTQIRYLDLDFMFGDGIEDRIVSLADLTSLEELVVCPNALALPPTLSANEYAAFFPQSIQRLYFWNVDDDDIAQLKKLATVARRLPNLEMIVVDDRFAYDKAKLEELEEYFADTNVAITVKREPQEVPGF